MRFTGRLIAPRFDLDANRKKLDEACRQAIAAAIREFLTAALARIPTWSGASRATFVKLAATVGDSVPISPVVPSQESLGISESDGMLTIEGATYVFHYETTLKRLNVNEVADATAFGFRLKNPGPYESLPAAVAAALHALEDFSYPSPDFVPKIINLGG